MEYGKMVKKEKKRNPPAGPSARGRGLPRAEVVIPKGYERLRKGLGMAPGDYAMLGNWSMMYGLVWSSYEEMSVPVKASEYIIVIRKVKKARAK